MKVILDAPGAEPYRLTRPVFVWILGCLLIAIPLFALSAPSVGYLINEAHIVMCYGPLVDMR